MQNYPYTYIKTSDQKQNDEDQEFELARVRKIFKKHKVKLAVWARRNGLSVTTSYLVFKNKYQPSYKQVLKNRIYQSLKAEAARLESLSND